MSSLLALNTQFIYALFKPGGGGGGGMPRGGIGVGGHIKYLPTARPKPAFDRRSPVPMGAGMNTNPNEPSKRTYTPEDAKKEKQYFGKPSFIDKDKAERDKKHADLESKKQIADARKRAEADREKARRDYEAAKREADRKEATKRAKRRTTDFESPASRDNPDRPERPRFAVDRYNSPHMEN